MHAIKRYTIFAFLGLAFLVWVTFAKVLGSVAYLADISDPPIIGNQFTLSTLVSLVIAVVGTWLTYRRSDVQRFTHDVFEELLKVAWPDWRATRTATIVVIITTAIVASILGVFDAVWAGLTGIIYRFGGAPGA